MAYSVALLVHSYLRWLLLVAGLVVIVRSVRGWMGTLPFTVGDNKTQVAFISVMDIQLIVGLALYFVLSPVTQAFFANPKAGMHDAQVRFFGVEHLALMLLGIVIVHVGRARSKRNPDGRARHRTTAITTLVWLVLTLGAIPWPGMAAGRPLFR
ncbi:MAG: hypothetical protein ABI321_01420 [Polyangia bacterium]